MYSFIAFKYVNLILWKEKYILGRIGLYFWGEAELISRIWGAKENTFMELRNFLSGIWGDQCIVSMDQGSTDPPPLGASVISSEDLSLEKRLLVYKLRKIVGSNIFSAQFIKIISHYKKIGYNINVLQQTACLVVNPITVGNFAFLFNCTPMGRTSDSMMVPT